MCRDHPGETPEAMNDPLGQMNIPVEELKIGMFVEIPLSWHKHPFLKNNFLIASAEDIQKIKDSGLDRVKVDLGRSKLQGVVRKEASGPPNDPAEDDREEDIVPPELTRCIHDRTLAAEKKANLVMEHSLVMMQNLLEKPTSFRISAAKKGISEIVNLILRDDSTTHYLININSHDFYTYAHSVNVGILGVALAKTLFNSSDHDLHALGVGFFLHDLGKVNIDPQIINKPAKLTEQEMREMRRHPAHGYKILLETKQLTREAKLIVLQHHERFDGSGYPRGLRKEEIHIYARLCSLADVYDALTSERPYRGKLPPFEALKLMREEMLVHFQPELFEKFVLMFRAPKDGCRS